MAFNFLNILNSADYFSYPIAEFTEKNNTVAISISKKILLEMVDWWESRSRQGTVMNVYFSDYVSFITRRLSPYVGD